jgi:protease IV
MMFSRNHPILFFIIMFISVVSAMFVLTIGIVVFGLRGLSNKADFSVAGEAVGIIEVNGVISDSLKTLEQIKQFKKNDSIKAVVLRVNSPGGGVAASQEIYYEINKLSEKKPVIASFGSLAASGGYYISAGADKIVTNPGTITGSIGVIMTYTNIEELFSKIGIKPVVIKSGEYKDVPSPVKKLSEKEKAYLEKFIKNIHDQFIDAVAEGRKMNRNKVLEIADGRIFSGKEAKDIGLVDMLGTIEDAIELAGREGGIKGEIKTVYADKEKLSFLKYITEESIKGLSSKFFENTYFFKANYLWRQ